MVSEVEQVSEDHLIMAAHCAAFLDNVAVVKMLHELWDSAEVLSAGSECARLALAAGIALHPDSEARLQRIVASQMSAGVVLKHSFRLPRDSAQDFCPKIFRMAGFLWDSYGCHLIDFLCLL